MLRISLLYMSSPHKFVLLILPIPPPRVSQIWKVKLILTQHMLVQNDWINELISLWWPYKAPRDLVSIVSPNAALPDGADPPPEPILT